MYARTSGNLKGESNFPGLEIQGIVSLLTHNSGSNFKPYGRAASILNV